MSTEPALPSPLARHAAALLEQLATNPHPALTHAVHRIYAALEEGGVCVPLTELGDPAEVTDALLRTGVVGQSGTHQPLILDGGQIFPQRYHACECAVAGAIRSLLDHARTQPDALDDPAHAAAFASGITFITGGPGTGKTTMVARVLAALAAHGPLHAALVAPTGKAAARLAQSVHDNLPAAQRDRVHLTDGTVHRILGIVPGTTRVRHNRANPLPHSVVVLDEASMVDLPLMARLLEAIDPAATRLLVVGDPGQLPAVQTGCVLADVADAARTAPADAPLARAFIRLTRNWRADAAGAVAQFVAAIQQHDDARALTIAAGQGAVRLQPVPPAAGIENWVRQQVLPAFARLSQLHEPAEALRQLGDARVLCSMRQGPHGVETINAIATAALRAPNDGPRSSAHPHGLPIIVTRNDPTTRLSNGDAGIVLDHGGRRMAWFDGRDGPRAIPLQRLPQHEPAYALTVHRSQGSEYRHVAVLFPPEDHPILTRELVYTAASRARETLTLYGSAPTIATALTRRSTRASGLVGRLA